MLAMLDILYLSMSRKISMNIVWIGLKKPILKKLLENCFMVDINISKFLEIFLQKIFSWSL